MYLMLGDMQVLYFDFNDFVVQELHGELVPFSMRRAFRKDTDMKSLLYNVQLLKSYLSRRVLSLSRDNAKEIYKLFCLPQMDDIDTRVKICLACRGVSVNDSYWIKEDDSNMSYSDVNIRSRHFREIVDISLGGMAPTITESPLNPELTTHGLFRKAWVREGDSLYLLKSDKFPNNINTRMEVLASDLLECFYNKAECVKYTGRLRSSKALGSCYVDKCKCFGNDNASFVEAWELAEYSKRIGISFKDMLGFSPEIASIGVLDFIISNTDRHMQNYGFWMSNTTGGIIGLAPLFDFNCALVADFYNRDASDTLSQMFNDGRTIRDIAASYKPYSRVVLDRKKFEDLRKKRKEYSKIFDNVLERCGQMGIV